MGFDSRDSSRHIKEILELLLSEIYFACVEFCGYSRRTVCCNESRNLIFALVLYSAHFDVRDGLDSLLSFNPSNLEIVNDVSFGILVCKNTFRDSESNLHSS